MDQTTEYKNQYLRIEKSLMEEIWRLQIDMSATRPDKPNLPEVVNTLFRVGLAHIYEDEGIEKG
jgi:hypothetical protein